MEGKKANEEIKEINGANGQQLPPVDISGLSVDNILNWANRIPVAGPAVANMGGFVMGIAEGAFVYSGAGRAIEKIQGAAKKVGETLIETVNDQRFTERLIDQGDATEIERAQVVIRVSEHVGATEIWHHQQQVIARIYAKSLLREIEKPDPLIEDKLLNLKHAMQGLSLPKFESLGLDEEQVKALRKHLPEY